MKVIFTNDNRIHVEDDSVQFIVENDDTSLELLTDADFAEGMRLEISAQIAGSILDCVRASMTTDDLDEVSGLIENTVETDDFEFDDSAILTFDTEFEGEAEGLFDDLDEVLDFGEENEESSEE